jgi:hypothetical protein
MSTIVAQVRVLFALVGLAGLGSCSSGSSADNPCGLTPSGNLTDGTFAGSMRFSGVAKTFPLQVVLDATARTLDGDVSFQDAVQSYDGTFWASVTGDGSISGGYSAVGASSGGTVTGTVSGVTDNQSACGTWKNTAGQDGTWDLARVAR